MKKYYCKIDFSNARDYINVYEIIIEALNFPGPCGCNLDALYDKLTEIIGDFYNIEIVGFENIERKFDNTWSELLYVFKLAKHAYNDKYSDTFNVTLIHEDGTKEVLK